MGNSSSRHTEPPGSSGRPDTSHGANVGNPQQPNASTRTRNRTSRSDFNLLTGFNPPRPHASQQTALPEQRRETRQEREARRLERDRVAREKERERSMREEHVDGGFLVTMGIYKGREDFSKPVVRQLQIERKLAPFWRPLELDVDDLNDTQLVYAARGLPVPEPDAPLPPDILAALQNPISPNQSSSNLNLAVPTSTHHGLTQGTPSEAASSSPGSALPSPTAPSHIKRSRGKAIAEALTHSLRSSRNNSQTDLSHREIALPNDVLVNGQPLEVVLYRSSEDCPICFASYPNHLNYTRCCGNMICSECFVQIKRPDPHIPEAHGESATTEAAASRPNPPDADPASRETHNLLVSEPSVCPYCTQPEFGVTYEPPPFRRGLVYANPHSLFGSSSPMSSQTSLHSNATPASPTSQTSGGRRRGLSLSANAPNVVTTDRIRPDWALKLSAQRTTQARRAAAATALHQAAFIMYNPERQFSIGGRAPRFMRRNTQGSNNGGGVEESRPGGAPASNADNDRLLQFEEVMMAEAIRLSLAAEEDRRRKAEREAEKEAKKEAKRREAEDRKAAKTQQQAGSAHGDVQASTSRSSVSLGLGRRRGNSGASNMRMETTPELEREESSRSSSSGGAALTTDQGQLSDKGKGVDRGPSQSDRVGGPSSSMAIPSTGCHKPSHLRQTSNISSLSSSLADSATGSYTGQGFMGQNCDASGASLHSRDSGAGPESLFNFASMASTLGIDLDHRDSAGGADVASGDGTTKVKGEEEKNAQRDSESTTQVPDEAVGDSVLTLRPPQEGDGVRPPEDKSMAPPELRLIPGSPMAGSDGEFSKNLEYESSAGRGGSEVA